LCFQAQVNTLQKMVSSALSKRATGSDSSNIENSSADSTLDAAEQQASIIENGNKKLNDAMMYRMKLFDGLLIKDQLCQDEIISNITVVFSKFEAPSAPPAPPASLEKARERTVSSCNKGKTSQSNELFCTTDKKDHTPPGFFANYLKKVKPFCFSHSSSDHQINNEEPAELSQEVERALLDNNDDSIGSDGELTTDIVGTSLNSSDVEVNIDNVMMAPNFDDVQYFEEEPPLSCSDNKRIINNGKGNESNMEIDNFEEEDFLEEGALNNGGNDTSPNFSNKDDMCDDEGKEAVGVDHHVTTKPKTNLLTYLNINPNKSEESPTPQSGILVERNSKKRSKSIEASEISADIGGSSHIADAHAKTNDQENCPSTTSNSLVFKTNDEITMSKKKKKAKKDNKLLSLADCVWGNFSIEAASTYYKSLQSVCHQQQQGGESLQQGKRRFKLKPSSAVLVSGCPACYQDAVEMLNMNAHQELKQPAMSIHKVESDPVKYALSQLESLLGSGNDPTIVHQNSKVSLVSVLLSLLEKEDDPLSNKCSPENNSSRSDDNSLFHINGGDDKGGADSYCDDDNNDFHGGRMNDDDDIEGNNTGGHHGDESISMTNHVENKASFELL
jgi:hypothetical protein